MKKLPISLIPRYKTLLIQNSISEQYHTIYLTPALFISTDNVKTSNIDQYLTNGLNIIF